MLGLVDPADPVIHAMSELGVIVLLFAIGLETELASLVRVGSSATTVAVAGVAVPFATGYFAAVGLGLATVPALVCGAALCLWHLRRHDSPGRNRRAEPVSRRDRGPVLRPVGRSCPRRHHRQAQRGDVRGCSALSAM